MIVKLLVFYVVYLSFGAGVFYLLEEFPDLHQKKREPTEEWKEFSGRYDLRKLSSFCLLIMCFLLKLPLPTTLRGKMLMSFGM